MDNTSVEIRSPRAAKIITTIFAVPCFCIAVLSLLSLFMPVFEGESPTVPQALFLGVGYFVFGAFLWWPVRKMAICADEESLFYHNGFSAATVRWDEVASYHSEQNPPTSRGARLVFLDAQHKVLLKITAERKDMEPQAVEQWREMRQFIDAKLDGKRVDAPYISFEPEVIAARSLEVDWRSKTVRWKIARIVGLVCYALFWVGLIALLAYFNINSQMPAGVFMALMFLIMYLGPLLPYIVWMKIKKRKIAREWEARDKIES